MHEFHTNRPAWPIGRDVDQHFVVEDFRRLPNKRGLFQTDPSSTGSATRVLGYRRGFAHDPLPLTNLIITAESKQEMAWDYAASGLGLDGAESPLGFAFKGFGRARALGWSASLAQDFGQIARQLRDGL